MPLPRLPDISLDTWIRDQQQQFERTISSIGEAFEFKDAVSDIESQIPADYPHPGGTDQWEEAQRQQQIEEYQRRQDEDEARRRQQEAEENQRQLDAYLNEKMRFEEQQRQQDVLTQAQQAGIPSPDQAFADFQNIQQNPQAQAGIQDFQKYTSDLEASSPVRDDWRREPSPQPAPQPALQGAPDPEVLQQQMFGGPPPSPVPALQGAPDPEVLAAQLPPLSPSASVERGYWTPTAKESEAMGESVGPEWLPEPVRRAAGVITKGVTEGARAYAEGEQAGPEFLPSGIRSGLGTVSAALEPVQAVADYQAARLDPQTWYFARDGIARTELDPGEFERWNELQGSQTEANQYRGKSAWTPEEAEEIARTTDKIERIYQSIKNDPDKLTEYAEASPAYRAVQMTTSTVLGGGLGNMAGGTAARGARALGASERVARGAGYAADIAAQTAFDPSTPAVQPLGDLALHGLGAGVRGSRSLLGRAGRALEASAEEAPQPAERLGSGVVSEQLKPPSPKATRYYHGTTNEFDRFTAEHLDPNGDWGPAAYMSTDPETSALFAPGEGGNMRRITLPSKIKLINGDRVLDDEEGLKRINDIFETIYDARPMKGSWERPLYGLNTFDLQYEKMVSLAGGDKNVVNAILSDAGYDGVRWRYEAEIDGKMHRQPAVAIFEASLDKMRNDFSGTAGGSGVIPNVRRPLYNAAQGAVFGAASEDLQAAEEGREPDPGRRLRNALIGGGITAVAGSRGARRALGRGLQALGSGVVPEGGGLDTAGLVQGVRQLRAAGAADDAVLGAERHIAENTNMTLDEVQRLTRAAEPEAGGGVPPREPSRRPPTTEEFPEDLEQSHLPGFEPEPAPKLTPAERRQAAVDQRLSAAKDEYQLGREKFRLDDVDAQAESILRWHPGEMKRLVEQARTRPGDRFAVEGRALQMNASAAAEAARRSAAEVLSAQRAVDTWKRANNIDAITDTAKREKAMQAMPEELGLRVEEAVQTAAILEDEFAQAFGAQARRGSQAGLELRSRRQGVTAARVYQQIQRGKSYFQRLTGKAEELAGKGGEMTPAEWKKLEEIQGILDEEGLSSEMIDAVAGGHLQAIEREGIAREQAARGSRAGSGGRKVTEREETAAEMYGRLARRRDQYRNTGDREAAQALQDMLDDLVENRIKPEADERAVKILDAELRDPLSPEAGMKAIEKAIGDKVVRRYNRAALEGADIREGPEGQLASVKQWRDARKLRDAFERSIIRALKAEQNEGIRTALRAQMSDARRIMQRAVEDPDFAPVQQHFRDLVDDLRQQPGVGKLTGEKLAKILEDRFEDLTAERAFTQAARSERDVANRINRYTDDMAERKFTEEARDEVGLIQARLRGVKDQLADVMKDKNAPGASARVRELLQDMRDMGQIGTRAADDQTERLFRANLLNAGKNISEADRGHLLRALADLRLDDPSSLQAVLKAMKDPTWWDKLREGSYISMLSNPWTIGTNALSNTFQLAGMLGLQSPLSYVLSAGENRGQLAGWKGLWDALPEARSRAGQVMKSGMSRADMDRVAQLGDVGSLRREYLSEEPGFRGSMARLYHMVSTRPLEAADQFIGHLAYSAKAAEAAQRKADRLLAAGDARVVGMSRAEAKQAILSDIWDHMDVIDQAGKARDYTLLKTRGNSKPEIWLRAGAALRDPGPNPTKSKIAMSILADNLMPFFNVPLNYAKQGIERTVGSPYYLGKGAVEFARGNRAEGGELMAKGAIGAIGMGTAIGLYKNDALTGDGPSDPGQRKVWAETHQPNSLRIGNQWYSYQGTPWAIPFGAVAGFGEGIEEAQKKAETTGADPTTLFIDIMRKGSHGALQGFASQSFLQGLSDQVSALFDDQTGLSSLSQYAANTATRYGSAIGVRGGAPTLAGMSNFLATMTDTMNRDAGRPSTGEDLPQNVGARIAMRIPGMRQQLDERIGAYGEPIRNQRGLVESYGLGVVPYYRGRTEQPLSDPVTESLLGIGVGRPAAPDTVTLKGGLDIPLTIPEQRVFDRAYGTMYREILDSLEEDRQKTVAEGGEQPVLPREAYEKMRDAARRYAVAITLGDVPPEELEQRIQKSVERKIAAPMR